MGNHKVVPVFLFNWAPPRKGVLGKFRYSSTHSLPSALDGGEWSASRSVRFTRRERAPSTHTVGGWVGPRAVLDAMVKRKIPSPRRESNNRSSIPYQNEKTWHQPAIRSKWKHLLCLLRWQLTLRLVADVYISKIIFFAYVIMKSHYTVAVLQLAGWSRGKNS
jgi:hypothetical protein